MKKFRTLQVLSPDNYLELRADARVLEADAHGEKVLQLADGTYLKLFRRKRFISSAAWYPYARRFADNAATLERLGIPCPKVIGVYRLPHLKRDAVHYEALQGMTLRQAIAAGLSDSESAKLRRAFRDFVSQLHELGIYFRSCHLGNVVVTPMGTLGLIDIADLKAKPGGLSAAKRSRNFRHIGRDARDRAWLAGGPE